MDKPEILIVEDEPEVRSILANELHAKGARVQIAADEAEALDIFYKRASTIDAVITDMRLRGSDKSDRSGGALGQRLKKIAPELPVYCNSAINVSGEFPFFDRYFVKGSLHDSASDIFENIDSILENATSYELTRYADIPDALISLKKKYRISDADFHELIGNRRLLELERTALLVFHQAVEQAEQAALGSIAPDSTLASRAYFNLVSPEMEEAVGFAIKKPVPLVLRDTDEVWIAELFGFPLIYSYAESRSEAIRHLLEILWGYHQDLQDSSAPPVTVTPSYPDYARFATFLHLLFD